MSREGARRPLRIGGVAAVLAMVASGCSHPGGTPEAKQGGGFRPQGRMLALGSPNGQHLVQVSLPSGRTHEFRLPATMDFLGNAFPGPGGSALVVAPAASNGRGYQLWRVSPGAAAVPLGTPVSDAFGFSVAGELGVAWSCGRRHRVFVMGLAPPTAWRLVADGCPAAISPDGREVAFLRDGALWAASLTGGDARRLLDLHDLGRLRDLRIGPNQWFGQMSWGVGGIAVTFGTPRHEALVVRSESGSVHVVPLAGFSNGSVWQPGGRLLAYSDFATSGHDVDLRLLDSETGSVALVSVSRNYGQFAWSPDGRTLAVARTADVVAFVDTTGRQLGASPIGGVPVAWTA